MNYIYKSLLQFCLWFEIPLKLLKVYIINVQDLRITINLLRGIQKTQPWESGKNMTTILFVFLPSYRYGGIMTSKKT